MDWNAVTAIATFLLVAATVWMVMVVRDYTRETAELRKAAQRQNELAYQPIVILDVKSKDRNLGEPVVLEDLMLHNIGCGPAFDVHILPIEWSGVRIEFEKQSLVAQGKSCQVRFRIFDHGQASGMPIPPLLLKKLQSFKNENPESPGIDVDVSYTAVNGKRYVSHHTLSFDSDSRAVSTTFKSLTGA